MTDQGFTGREAADHAGITYRQLDYWARTDVVRPSIADARGQGSRRRYSDRDLAELRIARALLDAGQRLEEVRLALTTLRDHPHDQLDDLFLIVGRDQVRIEPAHGIADAVLSIPGAVVVLQGDG